MEEASDLDMKLAINKAETANQSQGDSNFEQYVSALHQIRSHEKESFKFLEQAQEIEEHITFLLTVSEFEFSQDNQHPFIAQQLQEAKNLRVKAQQEVYNSKTAWKLLARNK